LNFQRIGLVNQHGRREIVSANQDTSMAAVASYKDNENDYLWNVVVS